MGTNTPASALPPRSKDLVEAFQTAAGEAFGVAFDLWARGETWTCLTRAEGIPAEPASGRQETDLAGILELSLQNPPEPAVVARPDGRYLVATALEPSGHPPLVAAATLSIRPEELLRTLARLLVRRLHQDRRPEESREEFKSYLSQISKDLEELAYLYDLTEHVQYWDISHSVMEVAQMILPRLRQVINAEAVVLVSAADDAACARPETAEVGAPTVWVGPRIISDHACCELVRRFQEAAFRRPVVKNRLEGPSARGDSSEVACLLLTPIVRDDCFIGWLLAVNRSEDGAFGEAVRTYPTCESSECDFGTVEVGLVRMATLVLAAHGRNVQMFRAMRKAKAQAEAANRAKTEFLANMSHEIRTPLNAILGYTDILIEESWGRAIVKNLQIIKRNGESLLHIVSDILDLSKIEAEKVDLELISCSPLHLIEDVASLMKVQADAKGLEFQVDYVGPIPERIRTDPTRLRQILINLLGNAIKFTERGSVRLVAELAEDRTRRPTMTFGVVDTGIGMSEEELAKVFQPFVQADGSTARRFGGTGLGLVISKRLAQILGGDITVWCAPRAGSTFCLWIPTGPLDGVSMIDVSHRAEVAPRDVAEETQRPVAAADLRILLAEDCPDNQRLISYFLRKTGADVTIAENGRMAVDLALAARDQDTSFDLILMDMQMPEMDGYQATTELRAAEYNGPIIALTAHAMSGDREKCIQAGCDDYVEKPISREKLIAAVAANSRKTAPRIRAQSTGGHPPNG